MKTAVLITIYLVAIIAANLLVSKFGVIAVLPVAFVFIGLDLTTRDYLHEIWRDNLWFKMLTLIGVGSLLSWLINKDAGQIALASFVAFLSANIIDTIIYKLLYKYPFLVKINGSNVFGSFTDSFVFLSIAFGSFMPILIAEQFAVKVFGGFIWSLLLRRFKPCYST